VTTYVVEAQKIMREKLADVTHVLLLGTVNIRWPCSMLAPTVKNCLCRYRLGRGGESCPTSTASNRFGLVTDVEPFLRELADSVGKAESKLGNGSRIDYRSYARIAPLPRRIITASSTRLTPG